jgi:hypothetical protein
VTTGKKRLGRPPKAEADRKSRNLTFRSRGDLRDRLLEAAQRSGRSLSEEIEYRLWQSILEDDKRLLEELRKKVAAYEQREQQYEQQRRAADAEVQRKLAAGETPSLVEFARAAGPPREGEEPREPFGDPAKALEALRTREKHEKGEDEK